MNNNYETSDLALASYLVYERFILKEIQDYPGSNIKKTLIFERKPGTKIEDIVEKYQRGTSQVEPMAYFNAIKQVKNRIYR